MIKDEFDKQFDDVEFISNKQLAIETGQAKAKPKIKKAYSTPEMRALQASKSKPHTKEAKEKIKQANIGKVRKGEDWIAGMTATKIGNQYHNKPFMTPSGAFASKKLATDWATENGVNNAKGKFDKWIKQRPDEFYYITPEEYELIKDNPKQVGLSWMENTKRYRNDQR